MAKLVIVESPSKASTIGKFLGKGYSVTATMGHVRDLPKSRLGVNVENDFEPEYITIRGKGELLSKLKKQAKAADKVFLATDPDREGEAISWHLAKLLGVDESEPVRITFNEITKNAVKNGIAHPRVIDRNLVDAQQARRVLDRIVGYNISPLLWRSVGSGLSAGRVQSSTLKLICDREAEIRAFKPQEYWIFDAELKDKASFVSRLVSKTENGIELVFASSEEEMKEGTRQKTVINSKEAADAIRAEIEKEEFFVASVKKGAKQQNPQPPFITSTLQQEASRRLNMGTSYCMSVAQQLYEGVEIDGTRIGLITYMRTDSLRLSDEAIASVRSYIGEKFGSEYLPSAPRVFKTKKNAQDAHEAIRPSVTEYTPESIKKYLTGEQFRLYRLIWARFVACQMAPSRYDTISVVSDAGKYHFRASDSCRTFDGYEAVYSDADSKGKRSAKSSRRLFDLIEGTKLEMISLESSQKTTLPPPRYNDATIVRAMEENGIGRPSTYAPTLSTLLGRHYVEHEARNIKPTELGEVTNEILSKHFSDIVDAKFTANMEQKLDEVEDGLPWRKIISDYYKDFSQELAAANRQMEGVSIKVPEEETGEKCEKCGRPMVIKNGRFGKFISCSGYPECKNNKPLVKDTGAKCPKCGGSVVAKNSRTGRRFYGCANYPNCDFVTWDVPQEEKCPKCGQNLYKKPFRNGKLYCMAEGCGYEKTPETAKKKTGVQSGDQE